MSRPWAKPVVSVVRDLKSILTPEDEKERGLLMDPLCRGSCTQTDNCPGHTGSRDRELGPYLVTGTVEFSPSFGLRCRPSPHQLPSAS